MTKSEDRRAVIINRMTDYVLAHGLSSSSLRPLAKAAGISDRMLLYYFKDKSEIITAALNQVAQRLVRVMEAQTANAPLPLEDLRARLMRVLHDEMMWPYMRIWLEIASLAAHGDPFFRAIGEQIGRSFLAWGASQLSSVTPEQREIDAAKLLVTFEGMLLLKSIGLDDVSERAIEKDCESRENREG
jgi:AcrR family transcriptional regulator